MAQVGRPVPWPPPLDTVTSHAAAKGLAALPAPHDMGTVTSHAAAKGPVFAKRFALARWPHYLLRVIWARSRRMRRPRDWPPYLLRVIKAT